MKKIVAVIVAIFVVFIIVGSLEQARQNEFKKFFGFEPSGTYYLVWTGDPNPALRAHEHSLINGRWDEEYIYLKNTYQKMTNAETKKYEELREEFLMGLEVLRDMRYSAYHFGYLPFFYDPDDLLKEEE